MGNKPEDGGVEDRDDDERDDEGDASSSIDAFEVALPTNGALSSRERETNSSSG